MAATPDQLIQRLLDTRLADLAGSRLSGTIALNDELGNEMLQLLLRQLTNPTAPPAPKGPSIAGTPGPADLLPLLTISRLSYATTKGKVQLNLDIAVDGPTNA
ncbi:MAG: hypothetical protein WBA17_10960 [Saprospiraceae bacterium]